MPSKEVVEGAEAEEVVGTVEEAEEVVEEVKHGHKIIQIQTTRPEQTGRRQNTLTGPHQAHVLTIIRMAVKLTIVLTPSAVHGPVFLLILVKNLSINDSLECLMLIKSTQSL